MSEDIRHKPGGNAAGLMALLIALPLVYGLSVGPMAYVLDRLHAPVTWHPYVVAFYQPVTWLHENTSLKKPIENYISWWSDLAKR